MQRMPRGTRVSNYISNKRVNKENVGPLQKWVGDLVTVNAGRAELP